MAISVMRGLLFYAVRLVPTVAWQRQFGKLARTPACDTIKAADLRDNRIMARQAVVV
jgi:hypothetical protein